MTEPVDYLGNRHAVEILRFIGGEGTAQARDIRVFTGAGNYTTSTCTLLSELGLVEVSKCDLDLRLVFYSLTDKGRQVADLLGIINDVMEGKA